MRSGRAGQTVIPPPPPPRPRQWPPPPPPWPPKHRNQNSFDDSNVLTSARSAARSEDSTIQQNATDRMLKSNQLDLIQPSSPAFIQTQQLELPQRFGSDTLSNVTMPRAMEPHHDTYSKRASPPKRRLPTTVEQQHERERELLLQLQSQNEKQLQRKLRWSEAFYNAAMRLPNGLAWGALVRAINTAKELEERTRHNLQMLQKTYEERDSTNDDAFDSIVLPGNMLQLSLQQLHQICQTYCEQNNNDMLIPAELRSMHSPQQVLHQQRVCRQRLVPRRDLFLSALTRYLEDCNPADIDDRFELVLNKTLDLPFDVEEYSEYEQVESTGNRCLQLVTLSVPNYNNQQAMTAASLHQRFMTIITIRKQRDARVHLDTTMKWNPRLRLFSFTVTVNTEDEDLTALDLKVLCISGDLFDLEMDFDQIPCDDYDDSFDESDLDADELWLLLESNDVDLYNESQDLDENALLSSTDSTPTGTVQATPLQQTVDRLTSLPPPPRKHIESFRNTYSDTHTRFHLNQKQINVHIKTVSGDQTNLIHEDGRNEVGRDGLDRFKESSGTRARSVLTRKISSPFLPNRLFRNAEPSTVDQQPNDSVTDLEIEFGTSAYGKQPELKGGDVSPEQARYQLKLRDNVDTEINYSYSAPNFDNLKDHTDGSILPTSPLSFGRRLSGLWSPLRLFRRLDDTQKMDPKILTATENQNSEVAVMYKEFDEMHLGFSAVEEKFERPFAPPPPPTQHYGYVWSSI
jgi:hypothetical protein